MKTFLINSCDFFSKHSVLIVFFIYTGYLGYSFICPEFFSDPIVQDDYALHYANAIEVVNHLTSRGIGWGYSPQFCGGSLSFGINEFWFAGFIFLLAPILGTILSFNLSILAGFLVPPVFVSITLKLFDCRRPAITAGTLAIALGLTGMIPLRSFYYTGCFGFVIGTSFCFLLLGILKRYTQKNTIRTLTPLCILGATAIIVHPLSAVVFLCLAFPYVITHWKQLNIVSLFLIIMAGLIAVAVNLIWLHPQYQYVKALEHGICTGMQTHPFFFWEVITGNKAFTVLSLLFFVQLFKLFQNKNLVDVIHWGISALLFCIIAFWGSQIGFNSFEPNRFVIPLIFVMIIVSVSHMEINLSRKNIVETFLAASFIVLVIKPIPAYTFGFKGYPAVGKIVETLTKGDNDQGRVLFQDAYDHPWFDCHFAALIPFFTGRETTANSFRLSPPRYAQFVENMLFGTTLDNITDKKLKENLHLFNISHILTYSEEARRFFNSCSLVTLNRAIENFTIYTVNNFDDNLCFNCSAEISATSKEIQIKNAKDSVTTLKYHYFKPLNVMPASLTITPVLLMDDPIPFIQVKNGTTSEFAIFYK